MRMLLFQLLTMSAAASVAALLVMVLRFPLKKAPRWLTCALWLVVLWRMVCPVGLSLPVSLIPSAVSDGTAVERMLSAVYVNGGYLQPSVSPSGEVAVPALPESEAADTTQSAPAPSAPTPSNDPPSDFSWSVVLAAVWAVGCAGTLLWGVLSYARWKKRIADAVLRSDNVYETDKADTPFVCGILKPRIVLPVGLSPADRPYVLLHEQAHIRRLDHLTKPLAYLALCVHWFNPVLWLGYVLYCRDVETACDEAVLRSFDREDTAGYAAALLHLGRAVPLPKAVPLAFGETNAKRRIDDVIRYRKPRLIVCTVAVLVCLLMAVLLLANPGTRGSQLEGVAITECCVWDGTLPVDVPEELRDELIHLLKQAGNDGYVKGEFSLNDIQKNNAVIFSDGNRGTEYWLLGGAEPLCLVRNNHDTYTYVDKPQQTAGLSKLASMPAYADWWSDLQDYLNNQRPDELYDLKTPYIGDATACGDILRALNAQKILGCPYTVELQTTEEPYGITLHAEGQPGSDMTTAAFNALSGLFCALVDNAETFTVVYDDLKIPRTIDFDNYDIENMKNLSREEFRSLYQRSTETMPQQFWSPIKALYLAPTMYSEFMDEGMSVYSQSAFAIYDDRFTANVNCLYSSAWPETETYWWPVYESHPVPAGETSPPLLAPDGAVVLDTRGRAYCNVNDTDGNFTGYRFYYPDETDLSDSLWMAHFTGDGDLEYLFQLQQKQGIVTPNGDVSAGYDDHTYLSSDVTLTAGDSHHMTLSLTMPDVTPESYVGGPLSWRECNLTAINREAEQAYSFSEGENRCVPSILSLKNGTLTAECGAVTGETLTPGNYEITLTAMDLLGGDGGVVSPGAFLWKGTVTLGDSPAVASTLSALSPVSALSDREAIREAVAGAFNARIHLGSFFSEDGTTTGFSAEQLAEMNAAYTEQVRTYYSKTYAPYWEYPQENEQALSRGFFVPSLKTPLFMLFDTGVLSCDIKRLSIDSETRTAAVTADMVTWSNAIWNFEDETDGTRYHVSAGCGKTCLTNELVMEDGRWKVCATSDIEPLTGNAPPLWSKLPWLAPSHLAKSKDETVAYCAASLLAMEEVSQTDYMTFEEALAAARTLDVVSGSYYSLWQALKA